MLDLQGLRVDVAGDDPEGHIATTREEIERQMLDADQARRRDQRDARLRERFLQRRARNRLHRTPLVGSEEQPVTKWKVFDLHTLSVQRAGA